jgi:hypothetical protein
MEEEQEKDTDRNGSISNIEDRPPREMVSPDVDIKEIQIEEVYNFAIEEGTFIKDHAVENPIDEVTSCAPKDHCKGETKPQRFVARMVKKEENCNAGDNGEHGEEQLTPDINAERHAWVLNVGKSEKVSQDLPTRTVLHAVDRNAEGWYMDSLYHQFGNLITQYNES